MLTKKQSNVLNYIKKYNKKNGYFPSNEEIRCYFKLSSVSTAHHYIKKLQKAQYLKKDNHQPRAISLKNDLLIKIPMAGTITAGKPIEALEDQGEMITVSSESLGSNETGDYYALKVEGDSMVEEGIFDGDIVIVKKQPTADNGDTVVAVIDDNEATLKKLYRENKEFRLQPANQKMLPLYRKEVEIKGIVVKVIRNFYQKKNQFRTIDLFAGIGGVRLGFERAGFETLFANDFEKNCKETYDLNFNKTALNNENIKKISADHLPDFDFLLAGFPCQAFSIAGYREGFNDKERGNLFFEIARIIEAKNPTGFLLENVKNLKGHDNGRTFKIIKNTLEELGYCVKTKILNSMEYGNVPQNRERIYIVGFKDPKHCQNFEFPDKVKLTAKMSDVLEKNVDEKYYYNGKPLYDKLKNKVTDKNKFYQWRRKYVRENKSGVCPTLTANMGMGGHNVPIIKDDKGIRKLTPRECASLQGFPKDFVLPNLADSALYKQIGNSVTVPVVEAVAKQIKRAVEIN